MSADQLAEMKRLAEKYPEGSDERRWIDWLANQVREVND